MIFTEWDILEICIIIYKKKGFVICKYCNVFNVFDRNVI